MILKPTINKIFGMTPLSNFLLTNLSIKLITPEITEVAIIAMPIHTVFGYAKNKNREGKTDSKPTNPTINPANKLHKYSKF